MKFFEQAFWKNSLAGLALSNKFLMIYSSSFLKETLKVLVDKSKDYHDERIDCLCLNTGSHAAHLFLALSYFIIKVPGFYSCSPACNILINVCNLQIV